MATFGVPAEPAEPAERQLSCTVECGVMQPGVQLCLPVLVHSRLQCTAAAAPWGRTTTCINQAWPALLEV